MESSFVTTSKHRNSFCLCFAQMEFWLLFLIFPSTPGVVGTSDNLALIKTSRVYLLSIPQKNSHHVGIVKSKKIYNRSSVFQLQSAGRWEQIDTAGCSHPAGACKGQPAELSQPQHSLLGSLGSCLSARARPQLWVAKALKLLSAKPALMRYWDLRLGLFLCPGGACGGVIFSWSSSPCSPGTVLRPVWLVEAGAGCAWGKALGTSGSANPSCHSGLGLQSLMLWKQLDAEMCKPSSAHCSLGICSYTGSLWAGCNPWPPVQMVAWKQLIFWRAVNGNISASTPNTGEHHCPAWGFVCTGSFCWLQDFAGLWVCKKRQRQMEKWI